MFWVALLVLVFVLSVLRLYAILPQSQARRPANRPRRATCTVAIFLGSGGHTSEALTLVSALDLQRYNQRLYLVSEGDTLSVQKAIEFESRVTKAEAHSYRILTIPRARRVHQSLLSTPFSAAKSLAFCIRHFVLPTVSNLGRSAFADVLILNGPGTCFILCLAVYINKFIGLPAPRIIYVETFARIKSLSLSGKLIRPLADRFVTQWPSLQHNPMNSHKWLV